MELDACEEVWLSVLETRLPTRVELADIVDCGVGVEPSSLEDTVPIEEDVEVSNVVLSGDDVELPVPEDMLPTSEEVDISDAELIVGDARSLLDDVLLTKKLLEEMAAEVYEDDSTLISEDVMLVKEDGLGLPNVEACVDDAKLATIDDILPVADESELLDIESWDVDTELSPTEDEELETSDEDMAVVVIMPLILEISLEDSDVAWLLDKIVLSLCDSVRDEDTEVPIWDADVAGVEDTPLLLSVEM